MKNDNIDIGKNIQRLRRRMGLNQLEFSRQVGIAPPTISLIESGATMPSMKVLIHMLEVLKVPADAIFASSVAELENELLQEPFEDQGVIHATLDHSKHTKQTREMTSALIASILALEDICQGHKHTTLPLHMPLELTHTGLENLATRIRETMRIHSGVLFDYFELFESFGLRIIVVPFYRKIESISFYDARNENAFIFINNRNNPEKQLFRLAYELGHLLLLNWSRRRGSYPETTPEERLDPKHAASKFAAFFLMPAEAIHATVSQLGLEDGQWSYELLTRIKHRFGISTETFLYRLKELNLIEPKQADTLHQRILEHYHATDYAEPADTRRILTPNGRLGDLLLMANRIDPENPELQHIENQLHEWEMEWP